MQLNKIKQTLKKILPDPVSRKITGLFYGWHGDYPGWEEAKKRCSGYDSGTILEKVSASAAKVRDGQAAFERDSVLFDETQYSYPVLSGLMWVAARNDGRLNIIDFGGSLGSSYYQNKKFLDTLQEVNWCVVEQPDFVSTGINSFATERLHFFNRIEDCLCKFPINAVLLSSVLPYIEKPYEILQTINEAGIKNIIIDRTFFIQGDDRLTIQKVHPLIYKADYPCWFFNKSKFLDFFSSNYDLILEFDAMDKTNLHSESKGFIFTRKQH